MLITKFLDLTNDFAFRKVFSSEKNKDILIHCPDISTKKTSIVDILCQDDKGNRYVVEMQVAKEKNFEKRAQHYASKAYVAQAHHSGKYRYLKKIIFLAITNFIMFPKKKERKSDHVILDKDSYEGDLKDFSFTFVELPKFNKSIDQLANRSEKWCYFLMERRYDEEMEKGIEKGREAERIEIAYSLLSGNVDIERIIKATQRSREEISKLGKPAREKGLGAI